MGEARICRVCLVMDVRMYDMQSFPLETYLEPILGVNVNPFNSIDLPPYVCYECASMLSKSFTFREKCLLSQSLLYSILQADGKISRESISRINRVNLNLASNIRAHTISTDSIINIIYKEPKEDLKEEPQDDVFDEKFDIFKEECDLDHDFPSATLSSDDDEPLAVRKGKQFKKEPTKETKKVNKGRKKKEASVDNVFQTLQSEDSLQPKELTIEDLLSTTKTEETTAPVKRKRGRPRKTETETCVKESEKKKSRRTTNTGGVSDDEIDLEEFVTIIKLTEKEQLEEIRNRQTSSNYQNAPFQCNLCYKGFIDMNAWNHHVGKHDPSAGDLECPVCKFRFKTKRTLQKHSAIHEKKYACKSCSYVSKTTTQAKQHQRWHKGVTYKCQYCDEVSTKWTSYLSHVRIKHPSEFICGICGYSFVSKLGLAMHRTMMHKDRPENPETDAQEDGPYCEECDVKFISIEAFKRHMVTSVKHTKSKDFNRGCRVCGESFKTAEELRLHHRKEHARKRPKNYGKKPNNTNWPAHCEHCSEVIPSAREYWAHFRRAHPDQSYPIQKNHVCDICGKRFRGNAFLIYHKRTHFEERAYKCTQCPKAFFNRTNLQMHEKTHSDNRPYPCNVCFKAFKSKGALDRHYRSHTGVKPYSCEVCGKAFGQSNSRKLHVRTVHLKQPAPYVSRARADRKRQPTLAPHPAHPAHPAGLTDIMHDAFS